MYLFENKKRFAKNLQQILHLWKKYENFKKLFSFILKKNSLF